MADEIAASQVDADIAQLGAALDAATRELSGEATLAQVRALRDAAVELRRPDAAKDARERFAASIARLDDEAIAEVARAVTHWFHLVNAAEEAQRVRMLRRYDRARPARYSLADAVSSLVAAGLDANQVRATLERLFIIPVLRSG